MIQQKDRVEKIFKIVYLIHLILSFNALYNISPVKNVSLVITLICGGVCLIIRALQIKHFVRRKDVWILSFFLVSFCISMLLNYRYGLSENIKCLLWMSFQIYILYLCVPEKGMEAIIREFKMLSNLFIVLITCSNVINCTMYLMKFNTITKVGTTSKRIGFFWSRLWGMYDDPNQGALFSAIVIIFSVYFIVETRRKRYIVPIIVQLLYISMSDSRTGLLCLALGTSILAFYIAQKKVKKNKILCAAIIAAACFAGILATYKPIQNGVSFVSNTVDWKFVWDDSEDAVEKIDKIEMGRDELQQDPSNRRFAIWKSGIELFKERPVVGLGRYSYVEYAKDNLPETYIVNNDFVEFSSLHNMFIEVLTSQGIIGIVIFLVYIVYCLKTIIGRYKTISEGRQWIMIIWFSILCMNILAAMLMPTLLYLNSPATYIFWLCLGYFLYVLKLELGKPFLTVTIKKYLKERA